MPHVRALKEQDLEADARAALRLAAEDVGTPAIPSRALGSAWVDEFPSSPIPYCRSKPPSHFTVAASRRTP